jgi:long-chain acyl-CoA synthetase
MCSPYSNFYEMLASVAQKNSTKKALFIADESYTYAQLLSKVDQLAQSLHTLRVGRGDHVALICPNSVEFVVSIFAANKVGAVIVPINTMLKKEEYCYILNDCRAKVLITGYKLKAETQKLEKDIPTLKATIWIDQSPTQGSDHFVMSQLPLDDELICDEPLELDDTAVIFYTSGTTGNPKGAMISNRNLFSNLMGAQERFDLNHRDRFIVYLPMFHSFTFSIIVMLPLYVQSSLVIVPSILPFSTIIKQALFKQVTIFMGVPDIYNVLLRTKLPWYFMWFNRIRCFISGGSALSEDTLNRFRATFKRATMLEGYGLSECSPAVAINPLEKQKTLSVGLPLAGYEVKIVDEEMVELPIGEVGELIVRGECVMQGYLNDPVETDKAIQNGWLRTGDMAKVDEEGYVYIVDRIKDLIISKGLNIYPRQIEEQMMLLPSVKLAAVIGQSDPHSGEVPIAFVELEEGFENTSITQIKLELKEHLAAFKIPKTITVVESLPKTATGKVLKRLLKNKSAS